jgi:hypothetical protein
MQELPLVAKEACLPGTLQANCHPCQQQRTPTPCDWAGCAPAAHFPLVVLVFSPLPYPRCLHSLFPCLFSKFTFAVHQTSARKIQGAAQRRGHTLLLCRIPELVEFCLLLSYHPSYLSAYPFIWLPDVLRQPPPRGPLPEEVALGVSTTKAQNQ